MLDMNCVVTCNYRLFHYYLSILNFILTDYSSITFWCAFSQTVSVVVNGSLYKCCRHGLRVSDLRSKTCLIFDDYVCWSQNTSSDKLWLNTLSYICQNTVCITSRGKGGRSALCSVLTWFSLSTHWPLGDLNEILVFYKAILVVDSWGMILKLPSDECLWALRVLSQDWFR